MTDRSPFNHSTSTILTMTTLQFLYWELCLLNMWNSAQICIVWWYRNVVQKHDIQWDVSVTTLPDMCVESMWGRTGGSGPPYSRGSTFLPPPNFPPTRPLFSLFFSRVPPTPNSDLPLAHLTPACPFFVKSPLTPTPGPPRPPVLRQVYVCSRM